MLAAAPASSAALPLGAQRAPTHPSGSKVTQDAEPRAPNVSPLLPGGQSGSYEPEPEAGSSQAEADPLVSNGLGSPSCRSTSSTRLDAQGRRDCETSGFAAAPAPTGDYGLDVHIDTGLLGLSEGGLLSIVQDLFVTPVWMALVWIVHALLVMLEWAFSLELLRGGAGASLQAELASAYAALTGPWLSFALSAAAIATVYQGLLRRRVAATLGETLSMGAMLLGGIWLIVDPSGTVGALSGWANEAGMSALAASDHGSPAGSASALQEGVEGIFATAVEAPWCYLEFGNVGWCREPSRLDPTLRSAALRIAGEAASRAHCGAGARCEAATPEARSLLTSARLLREARSNGALFAALPANGPQRNSINDSGSLLRELCGSSQATECHGATAAQAEFRTGSGTWARVGGLLLIVLGMLGLMLLLGHVVARLLGAALMSVFYLLLAPGIVLATPCGERGRAIFRGWTLRLFGAVLCKLVFAFLLGAILLITQLVQALRPLGWWTQWLLVSAFWWMAYLKRGQLLDLAPIGRTTRGAGSQPIVRTLARRLQTSRHVLSRGQDRRWRRPPPQVTERPALGPAEPRSGPRIAQTGGPARGRRRASMPAVEESRLAQQLERVEAAREQASRTGDRRRAVQLTVRGDRIGNELERARSRRVQAAARPSTDRGQETGWFLDAQAKLPSAREARTGTRRDYPGLAGLAGITAPEYERLDPGARRATQLTIDRELALRRAGAAQSDRTLRVRSANPTAAAASSSRVPPPDKAPREIVRRRPEAESPVMRDAREVAAGRKRQLGFGRD